MTDLFKAPDQIPTQMPAEVLPTLVGEGQKYKTVEDLAKSRVVADQFIEQIKRENAGLRAELDQALKDKNTQSRLEEIADRLASLPSSSPQSHEPQAQADRDVTPAIAPDKIAEIARSEFANLTAQAQRQANLASVAQTLKERFGDNFANTLTELQTSTGLSKEDINELAMKSPKALLNMLPQGTPRDTTPTAPRTRVNSDTFQPVTSSEKSWNYFEGMRTSADAKVRAQYWSVPVQAELHNIAIARSKQEAPEAFYKK